MLGCLDLDWETLNPSNSKGLRRIFSLLFERITAMAWLPKASERPRDEILKLRGRRRTELLFQRQDFAEEVLRDLIAGLCCRSRTESNTVRWEHHARDRKRWGITHLTAPVLIMNANTRGHKKLMIHDRRFMDQRTIDVINEEYADWELVTSIYFLQSRTDWVYWNERKNPMVGKTIVFAF